MDVLSNVIRLISMSLVECLLLDTRHRTIPTLLAIGIHRRFWFPHPGPELAEFNERLRPKDIIRVWRMLVPRE